MGGIFKADISGLIGSTAYVVASNAPYGTRVAALRAQRELGALVQLCDGIADNVQIQAAIDALPAAGGTVVLSEGTFTIAAGLTMGANIVLSGQGQGATIIQRSANCTMLTVQAVSGSYVRSRVESLQLDGTGYTGIGLLIQPSNGAGGFIYQVYLRDIEVRSMTSSEGIETIGLSEFGIENCYSWGSQRQLYMHGSAGTLEGSIRRCTFIGGATRTVTLGASGENCVGVNLAQLSFGGAPTGATPIALACDSVDNCLFDNLYFEHTGAITTAMALVGYANTVQNLTCQGTAVMTNGLLVSYGGSNRIVHPKFSNPNITNRIAVSSGVTNTEIVSGYGSAGPLSTSDISNSGTGTEFDLPVNVTDPGNGGAIAITASGRIPLVTAGAETRTLAAPAFIGQELTLYCKTFVGNCVVTCATTINEAGNNTITFTATGQAVRLFAVEEGATLRWRCAVADGAALSTV